MISQNRRRRGRGSLFWGAADGRRRPLAVGGVADDATVAWGGLSFLASREAAAALRRLRLPAGRHAEGRSKRFRRELVLLLLAGDHVMGERV